MSAYSVAAALTDLDPLTPLATLRCALATAISAKSGGFWYQDEAEDEEMKSVQSFSLLILAGKAHDFQQVRASRPRRKTACSGSTR